MTEEAQVYWLRLELLTNLVNHACLLKYLVLKHPRPPDPTQTWGVDAPLSTVHGHRCVPRCVGRPRPLLAAKPSGAEQRQRGDAVRALRGTAKHEACTWRVGDGCNRKQADSGRKRAHDKLI